MIRQAEIKDTASIRNLIEQLGYNYSTEVMHERVQRLMDSSADEMFVYENEGKVLALVSLHYIIQLGFDGDFCELTYFVVDENARGKNIGGQLEAMATERAKEKKCSMMTVFSLGHRKDAHRFYERQGYTPTEKYFEKEL